MLSVKMLIDCILEHDASLVSCGRVLVQAQSWKQSEHEIKTDDAMITSTSMTDCVV